MPFERCISFAALDVETERTTWERLLADPGVTCLAVSHRRTVLQRAERIIVLKEGRKLAEGTLAEILPTCEAFRQIWTCQTGTEDKGDAVG